MGDPIYLLRHITIVGRSPGFTIIVKKGRKLKLKKLYCIVNCYFGKSYISDDNDDFKQIQGKETYNEECRSGSSLLLIISNYW